LHPLSAIFSFLQNVKEVVKIVPEVIKSNSKSLEKNSEFALKISITI